jgi:hypothetical protein
VASAVDVSDAAEPAVVESADTAAEEVTATSSTLFVPRANSAVNVEAATTDAPTIPRARSRTFRRNRSPVDGTFDFLDIVVLRSHPLSRRSSNAGLCGS